MIGLNRYINAKLTEEKFVILFSNLFIIGSIIYSAIIAFNFKNENLFTIGLACIFLAFSIYLSEILMNFINKKKVHIGTFDYFITNINPSESVIANCIKKIFLNKEEAEPEPTIIFLLPPILVLAAQDFKSTILLIVISVFLACLFVGAFSGVLNKENVSVEKLNLIDKVEDLDFEEIEYFKELTKECIDQKGFVNKADMLIVYGKVLEKQIIRFSEKAEEERKRKEELKLNEKKSDYNNLFTK